MHPTSQGHSYVPVRYYSGFLHTLFVYAQGENTTTLGGTNCYNFYIL